jgi:uncharacterized membrane protein YbaN (DUF454 family)
MIDLINNTPLAFRESLPKTETWAVIAADRQQQVLSNQFKSLLSDSKKKSEFLDEQLHGADEKVFSPETGSDNDTDSDAEDKGGHHSSSSANDEANGGGREGKKGVSSSLMNQFRAIANRFQDENSSSTGMDTSFDDPLLGEFDQDRKLTADTICLWSNVEEVIPCVCSNLRFNIYTTSLKEVFYQNTISKSDNNASSSIYCFFLSHSASSSSKMNDTNSSSHPFYFAIDCRKNDEKSIGIFPKAYLLDPDVIFDGEGLNGLLAVLEPISATTHICIIGKNLHSFVVSFVLSYCCLVVLSIVFFLSRNLLFLGSGADYYKWLFKQKYKKRTKKMRKEQEDMIADDQKRVNALALMLIKKGFKYIRYSLYCLLYLGSLVLFVSQCSSRRIRRSSILYPEARI